ncbi:MAG: hypothetical protein ACLS5K_01540 [Streptococcus salivarius]
MHGAVRFIQKVMGHFTPNFYLGMTATPERTDGQNIYEILTIILPMRSFTRCIRKMTCSVCLFWC